MILLRQSTAYTAKIGPFIDEDDGKTAETGLTISQADVRLSKNGGNIAQKGDTSSCTHDELGYYDCPLSATDTGTLGKLQLFVHESGALPVWHEFMVMPANVYDSFFSTDYLRVDCYQAEGGDFSTNLDAWVESTVEDLIFTYRLDELVKSAALAPATGSIFGDLLMDDSGTWKFSANALEEAPSGGSAPSAADVADAVWDEAKSGHVAAGSFGEEVQAHALSTEVSALNNLSTADIAAELATYDAPTKAELDAGLAGLNDLSTADVAAELATYDAPTKAELDAGLAALNDLTAAQVNAEVDQAIADARLDEFFVTALSAQPVANSLLADMTEDDGGQQRFNANALETAASGGLTLADIADAVADEMMSGHTTPGSAGAAWTAAAAAVGGTGAIKYTYTVTNSVGGAPIPAVLVWATSDSLGTSVLASGYTDANGQVVFYLDAGTIYVWKQKAGWNFSNPQTDTVS